MRWLWVLLVIFVLPILLYHKRPIEYNIDCIINDTDDVQVGQGYFIIENMLSDDCLYNLKTLFHEESSKNKKLNENKELSFYTDTKFINSLSRTVGFDLYPVNSLDSQRCWLRYYYEGMKSNYYENWHHDKNRYGNGVKQYRLVIPVYDTSDAIFSFGDGNQIEFKQNTGVLIKAGNCLHKVDFTSGERLVLIMDFTTEPCDSIIGHFSCRGPIGYFWWIVDVIWRKLSSLWYEWSNRLDYN